MSVSGSRSITLNTALTPSISWSTKNVIVESISLETEIVTPWRQIHSILPFAVDTSESVLGDGIGTSLCVWSSTGALRVSILQIVNLTNRQQFVMVCTLIDHGNDISRLDMIIPMTSKCSKLKWNHEWFHWKVLNILTSLLCSIRVQTIGKLLSICFFYNNLDGFEVVVFRKNARARERNTNCSTVTSFSWSALLSTITLQPRSQGSLSSSRPLNSAREITQLL